MGILCAGPAYIEVDNQSVISNTNIPESTLMKKFPKYRVSHGEKRIC